MKIQYSTQATHPITAPELTNGLILPVGSYAIWSDVSGTFMLTKDGQNAKPGFFPHTENGAPFDMNGSAGANAILFPVSQGAYALTFTPKTEPAVTINFTVGSTTTPPPDIEEIKEPMFIENGTHLVVETVSGKKYKAAVTKI